MCGYPSGFPEEQLFINVLFDENFMERSVWASLKGIFDVDGKPYRFSNAQYPGGNADDIEKNFLHKNQKSYDFFNLDIDKFMSANKKRLDKIAKEAYQFVKNTDLENDKRIKYISFSGGKDSTASSHVVTSALSNPSEFNSIKHVFGDTTLELKALMNMLKG